MSSNGSGKKLEGFFTGKGFYIVLFLCAAVIGVSAWMMAAGNKTMAKDLDQSGSVSMDNRRVETVIITPEADADAVMAEDGDALEATAPELSAGGLAETGTETDGETAEVWREGDVMEVAAPLYVWPVSGELERQYSVEALRYDVTMRDWRTHDGIDILAQQGAEVTAAHAGTVESIVSDDLLGTTVTVDHGDGAKTVYANLDPAAAVSVGDWVEPGAVIGRVGSTALGEVSQSSHLRFAIIVNGAPADPLAYLPA